jgi:phosphoribosylaminoimidazolecarboxamide formyltransferase/IMP cyclohydrolase
MAGESADGWMTIKNSCGGYLGQLLDNKLVRLEDAKLVTGEEPNEAEMRDLNFAWAVCKHVKSNAIVVAKDLTAIGVGAGQMNRVDSARLALSRAESLGHDVKGAVAASDAFLPFPDTLEVLNDAGVVALVQPGGSMRDDSVVEVAKERNVTMMFTGNRHFKH